MRLISWELLKLLIIIHALALEAKMKTKDLKLGKYGTLCLTNYLPKCLAAELAFSPRCRLLEGKLTCTTHNTKTPELVSEQMDTLLSNTRACHWQVINNAHWWIISTCCTSQHCCWKGKENHFKICLPLLCVCGPHCTWKSLQLIKVVEPNNFLMYNHAWRCDQVQCV